MSQDFTVDWFGEQFFVLATKNNLTALKKAGFVLERAAKKILSLGGSRKSKFKKGKFFYVPSSPGEPPHLRTGILRSSVTTQITESPLVLEGFVGSDIDKIRDGLSGAGLSETEAGGEYGFFLEVGTRFMKKRPWLRPALMQSRKLIFKIFSKANRT